MSRPGIFRFVEDGIYRKNPHFVLVIGMRSIEIPESPRLRGEEAIWAVNDFVTELRNRKGKELTERQIAAVVKFVQGLTASIEEERKLNGSKQSIKEMRLVSKVRRKIMKFIPQKFQITRRLVWGG